MEIFLQKMTKIEEHQTKQTNKQTVYVLQLIFEFLLN